MTRKKVLPLEVVCCCIIAMDGNGKMLGFAEIKSDIFKNRSEFYDAVYAKRDELAREHPGSKRYIGFAHNAAGLMDGFGSQIR